MKRTRKPGEKKPKRKGISHAARTGKGRELQKWTADQISLITGFKAGKDKPIESRPGRQSGTDVRMETRVLRLFPFSVECKRQEAWAVHNWVKQAKANQLTEEVYTDWLLVAKRSRSDCLVIMDAVRFFEIYGELIKRRKKGK